MDHRVGRARGEVVAVEGDVEVAERDVGARAGPRRAGAGARRDARRAGGCPRGRAGRLGVSSRRSRARCARASAACRPRRGRPSGGPFRPSWPLGTGLRALREQRSSGLDGSACRGADVDGGWVGVAGESGPFRCCRALFGDAGRASVAGWSRLDRPYPANLTPPGPRRPRRPSTGSSRGGSCCGQGSRRGRYDTLVAAADSSPFTAGYAGRATGRSDLQPRDGGGAARRTHRRAGARELGRAVGHDAPVARAGAGDRTEVAEWALAS